jgi:hypothetical protein
MHLHFPFNIKFVIDAPDTLPKNPITGRVSSISGWKRSLLCWSSIGEVQLMHSKGAAAANSARSSAWGGVVFNRNQPKSVGSNIAHGNIVHI